MTMILTRARVILIALVLCSVAGTLYATHDLWQSAGAITTASHQALYQLRLSRLRQSNSLADVRGEMSYRIEDACDGWNVAQRFNLQFVYSDQPSALETSDYNTYESKDGQHYQFSTRHQRNGQITDEILGKAERNGPLGDGVIDYERPKTAQAKLGADVLFPTQHTLHILQEALAGKQWFTAPLFDGSDLSLANDVNVFATRVNKPYIAEVKEIMPLEKTPVDDADDAAPVPEESTAPQPMTVEQLNANPLIANTRAWRIRMAFYPRQDAIQTEDQKSADLSPEDDPANAVTPDYEMTMVLHSNGVVSSFTLDYPDFSLDANLLSIAEVAKNSC